MKTSEATKRVFLCHSHRPRDRELARDLRRRLRAAGLETLEVRHSLSVAAAKEALREAIRSSDAVVVLVTPEALDSPWTMFEVGLADGFEVPVLPVVAGLGDHPVSPVLASRPVVPYDRVDEGIRQLTLQLANGSDH